MRHELHFCQFNRAWALDLTNAYVQHFRGRLFSTFKNIEQEAENFAQAEYERRGQSPAYDDSYDMSMIADDAQEAGIQYYSDLQFVQGQLHGLATAGLYHLWERTLKSFLLRELGHLGILKSEQEKIKQGKFKYIDFLKTCGFDVRSEPFFTTFNHLRLITNTVKHGDSKDFERLYEEAPMYFNGPLGIATAISAPNADDLWITEQNFEELSNSVIAFWKSMPEYLSP